MQKGVITHLDVTIFEVCVRRLCDTECVCVALDPHVCTDALHGIIREGGDVIRIECDYDESQRCVRLYLMVDKERFDQLIEGGRLPAEEHVINLARQVWREVNVPQHCDAEPEPSPLACIDSWNEKHPFSPTRTDGEVDHDPGVENAVHHLVCGEPAGYGQVVR